MPDKAGSKAPKHAKKILVGMTEIAGQYRNLSLGLTAIGVEHDFITYSESAFQYGGETKTPHLLLVSKKLRQKRRGTQSLVTHHVITVLTAGLEALWAVTAMFRYDTFIFGFGSSLLPKNLDLPILKLLGKRVISNIGHGSEARAPYLNGKRTAGQKVDAGVLTDLILSSKKVARKVRFIEKYSTLTVGSPYSSSFFAKNPMVNRLALGRPVPAIGKSTNSQGTDAGSGTLRKALERPIRIIHCPSDRAAKGTAEIVSAVERLCDRGHNIDFRLLERLPNSEILAEIAVCDFVIDQLYSDLPMPAISTEAAMYGKPAIVAGYDLEALRTFMPEDMWPPIYICQPDEIEAAIEDLVLNEEKRDVIGKALSEFVASKWSLESYAKRYMKLIDGSPPPEWWFDPKEVRYFYGCGQSREATREIVSNLVKFGGIDCLHLSNNDVLRESPWLGIN